MGCLPPFHHHHPSFNAALHQASNGSGSVREERRWNSRVWRRVMRDTWREWSLITAAVKRRGHLSSGDRSLSRACMLVSSWDKEGSIEGFPWKFPEHCPSFTNPAARRIYQIPCLFRTLFPFGHFILLFLLNKNLSEAWRHAHCVCHLLFRHYIYIYIYMMVVSW